MLSCAPCAQQQQADDVDDQAHAAGEQDQPALELRGVAEPADRAVGDPAGQAQQDQAVGAGGQDLGAGVAERPARAGTTAALRDRDRRERHDDAERVAQHVAGIGQQREAAGDPGDDCFDDQDADDRDRTSARRPRCATPVPCAWSCPMPLRIRRRCEINEPLSAKRTPPGTSVRTACHVRQEPRPAEAGRGSR